MVLPLQVLCSPEPASLSTQGLEREVSPEAWEPLGVCTEALPVSFWSQQAVFLSSDFALSRNLSSLVLIVVRDLLPPTLTLFTPQISLGNLRQLRVVMKS